MTSLVSLHSANPDNYVLNKYMNCSKESFSLGKFWLGGQLRLKIDELITEQHLADVIALQTLSCSPTNAFEFASIQRSEADFSTFRDVYYSHIRKLRYSGLLRVIVFWLAPARKRAAEKIFHPQKLYNEGYFNQPARSY